MDWLFDHAALIGLIFFVVFFAVMTVWVYRPKAKQRLENFANIPFQEDRDERS